MCGIFGHTNFELGSLGRSRKALHTLSHRGPDQWGEWYSGDVYLGHRRLSILDLSDNGKQPMKDKNENTVIAVNGEIYNYLELKKQLNNKCSFKSESDSEVILHCYNEWGIEGLLSKLDGMFAISIYDKRINKIYLARDRVGIKPLYYSNITGLVCWASELKAIQEFYSDLHMEIDYTAVYDYLTYLYIPTPKTLYSNVYKLEPGSYLEVDCRSNRIKKTSYWDLIVGRQKISVNEAAEELKCLVKKSVNSQLISDVPLGIFLSGGIDSSVILASTDGAMNTVNTYNIGFLDNESDESEYAKMVSQRFNANHSFKYIEKEDFLRNLYKLKDWYDEPYADTSAFPTFLVSEFTRTNCTVALSGDGGDELFGGYNRYLSFEKIKNNQIPLLKNILHFVNTVKRNHRNSFFGKVANRVEDLFILDDLDLYAKLKHGMMKSEKVNYANLWGISEDYDDYWYFRKYYRKDLPIRKRLQYMDFKTLLHDDFLTKIDRVSMAVSLEARVPLLSNNIVDFAFSLPQELVYFNGQLKGILKYAFRGVLPDEVLFRPKKGFSVPWNKWQSIECDKRLLKQEVLLKHIWGIC